MSLLRKQESRCPRCLMMGCLDSRLRGKDIESAYFLRKCSVVTPVTTRHPSPQEGRRYTVIVVAQFIGHSGLINQATTSVMSSQTKCLDELYLY